MKKNIKAVRGTRDILPEEAEKWEYIESKARNIFNRFGYREIRLPIFEETALFTQGIGESTDIVEKEMYSFSDKKGRSLTLRPEATASVVRAYLEHKIYLQESLSKLYYLGPMFRYERPQAGRSREFYQLGVEAIGNTHPALDSETVFLAIFFLQELGLKDLGLQINSIGCENCRNVYKEDLKKYFARFEKELCANCVKKLVRSPLRILDCKNEKCRKYIEKSPVMGKYLCENCFAHFKEVKEYLKELKLDYTLNPYLVRGLDYYTRTTFEIIYRGLGAQNALGGGGRYDNLIEEMGGPSIPGVGFSLGLERILFALEKQGVKIPVSQGIDVYLVNLGEESFRKTFALSHLLQRKGLVTFLNYENRSLKSQLKSADKVNAKYAIIMGKNELKKETVIVRDMKKSTQRELSFEKYCAEIRK